MLDGQVPLSWQQRVVREGLWALGGVLVVATLYVTVFSNSQNGSHGGLVAVPASAWTALWDNYLSGHFWIMTGVTYGLGQIIRLTLWIVQKERHSH
jgi:hypothetical protein